MPVYTDKRNGHFFVQFDYKGQTFKQSLPKAATRSDANKLEVKMRSDAFFQANGMAPKNEVIFDDLVQEYLGHIKGNPGKYQKAEYVLIAAKPFLKNRTIRGIKPADIERFIQYRSTAPSMHDRTRKPATIWREVAVLSALFSYAVKNEYLEANPCVKVEKPKFDNLQDTILALEDQEKFLEAFEDDTAKDICLVVLNTGLSRNDVLSLTAFHINRHTRMLNFTRNKTQVHVSIFLNDKVWAVIAPRLSGGLLFPSSKTGKTLTSIRTAITGACRRAGIPRLTIRDLRRTYATRLDTDDVTKSRLLGHSDTRMMHRYVRCTEKMRKALEKLAETCPSPTRDSDRLAK